MKNKDVEDIVFKALDFFDRERDSEVDKITK